MCLAKDYSGKDADSKLSFNVQFALQGVAEQPACSDLSSAKRKLEFLVGCEASFHLMEVWSTKLATHTSDTSKTFPLTNFEAVGVDDAISMSKHMRRLDYAVSVMHECSTDTSLHTYCSISYCLLLLGTPVAVSATYMLRSAFTIHPCFHLYITFLICLHFE